MSVRRSRPSFRAVVIALVAIAAVVTTWRVVASRGALEPPARRSPLVPTRTPRPSETAESPVVQPRPHSERKEKKKDKERYEPSGHLEIVGGSSDESGGYRFTVAVERGLPIDEKDFAAEVVEVLNDERSWGGSFERVHSGPVSFTVALASPELTDELCAPLPTGGIFSCYQAGKSVLNYYRWKNGASAYGDGLRKYHIYMVNHEVGHALGHGHASCPGAGQEAPVMMQQTKGVSPCKPNPWPLDSER